MADTVTCTLQNDVNGNPQYYNFVYNFDDGFGNTTDRAFQIWANKMVDAADPTEARTMADGLAVTSKSDWLSHMFQGTQVAVAQVSGDVVLKGVVDPRTPSETAQLQVAEVAQQAQQEQLGQADQVSLSDASPK